MEPACGSITLKGVYYGKSKDKGVNKNNKPKLSGKERKKRRSLIETKTYEIKNGRFKSALFFKTVRLEDRVTPKES
jgi:hypothetical protein